MSGLEKIFDLKNLRRAYRWIMSNPDAQYKSYFRDSYETFAYASDSQLKWIRKEGLRDRYTASHASKILTPKPSGTLRPITLLTVEDQIVYQACVNLVAELIKKKTRHRYNKRVFAHLYSGKSSPFFYSKWQKSYNAFSQRIRDTYSRGYEYLADFDLTAFYDSIDHRVLKHFLKETGVDEDVIDFLDRCLVTWTSSTWSYGPPNIYHGHGIPQGPLSSGMLSEVVLQHIDQAGEHGSKTIYLRYVDDVKILAKNEDELRLKLMKLDISAKEIGLFPQTSKINIHRIADPDEEVKSVSRPPEAALYQGIDKTKLISRIRSMSRNGKVGSSDVTRFKYLLAHATPTYRLNLHVMKVLYKHPELAPAICRYISSYKKIPEKLAQKIIDYLRDMGLYHSVNGLLLRACLGRMPDDKTLKLGMFCARKLPLPGADPIKIQPVYKEALIAWALYARTINFTEYNHIVNSESDWWVKKSAMRELTEDLYGKPTYADFINRCLRSQEPEVARVAASRLLKDKVKLTRPYGDVEITAKKILGVARVIPVVGQPVSRINEILSYVLKRRKTQYDWKNFFSQKHQQAEIIMLDLKRDYETNINAFIVLFDSYCDLLVEAIYGRLKPQKEYPSFGHAIKDKDLVNLLPKAMTCFHQLHRLRLESTTAHPRSRIGQPTRRLKHHDYRKIRQELVDAFDEIESNVNGHHQATRRDGSQGIR